MEQTHSIKQLILDIDAKRIALPEFQRDFVWEISKTHDLFDSLDMLQYCKSISYVPDRSSRGQHIRTEYDHTIQNRVLEAVLTEFDTFSYHQYSVLP